MVTVQKLTLFFLILLSSGPVEHSHVNGFQAWSDGCGFVNSRLNCGKKQFVPRTHRVPTKTGLYAAPAPASIDTKTYLLRVEEISSASTTSSLYDEGREEIDEECKTIELHLFSLKCPTGMDQTINSAAVGNKPSNQHQKVQFSKAVAETWRWKDDVVGDGRDYFVPKPKTLRALQTYLLSSIPGVQECLVISNCARFEVLLAIEINRRFDDDNDDHGGIEPLLELVSRAISKQVQSYKSRPHRTLDLLQRALDRPQLITDHNALFSESKEPTKTPSLNRVNDDWMYLLESYHWNHISNDVSAILLHLCFMASGIAQQPRRPDRPVVFRPFSSRDAHVMLQLKRSLEVITVSAADETIHSPKTKIVSSPSSSRTSSILSKLLKCALQAGKSVRNPNRLPELNILREYGGGDSKFSTDPPLDVSNAVQEAAIKNIINPLVEDCSNQWELSTKKSNSIKIKEFRQKAEMIAGSNITDLAWIRQQIHLPTTQLRQGFDVDTKAVLQELETHISQSREVCMKNSRSVPKEYV